MRLSTRFIAQRGIDSILEQQSRLANIQEQISSGKRINKPSDDPSGAAQILRLTNAIETVDQYQRNSDYAKSRLNLEESVMNNAENSIIRLKELVLQANNSTLTNTERVIISKEVEEIQKELLGLANTRDANQEYLFSGTSVNIQPFIKNTNGTFSYSGDQVQRQIQISASRTLADSHTGTDVFTNILNGNGTFIVDDTPANTGDGIIDAGQVTDFGTYVEDTYTITFTVVGDTITYGVTGAVSGAVIAPGAAYTSGSAISFNGIETNIIGTPENGDTFTISPSVKQNAFTTTENIITALQTATNNPVEESKVFNDLNRALADLDRVFENFTQVRTDIGTRLNVIDKQTQNNQDFKLDLEATRSQTEDLDLIEAVVQLTARQAAFEAAQASYSRIQSLSLFDFI